MKTKNEQSYDEKLFKEPFDFSDHLRNLTETPKPVIEDWKGRCECSCNCSYEGKTLLFGFNLCTEDGGRCYAAQSAEIAAGVSALDPDRSNADKAKLLRAQEGWVRIPPEAQFSVQEFIEMDAEDRDGLHENLRDLSESFTIFMDMRNHTNGAESNKADECQETL